MSTFTVNYHPGLNIVPAEKLALKYYAKHLNGHVRLSHRLPPSSPDDIYSRQDDGYCRKYITCRINEMGYKKNLKAADRNM